MSKDWAPRNVLFTVTKFVSNSDTVIVSQWLTNEWPTHGRRASTENDPDITCFRKYIHVVPGSSRIDLIYTHLFLVVDDMTRSTH